MATTLTKPKRPDKPHYQAIPPFLNKIQTANEKTDKPFPRLVKNLPNYRFWSPNAHNCIWVLTIDLDRDDSLLHFYSVLSHHNLAAPSYIIEKFENGHAQAGWFIERVATGPNSRPKPQEYARSLRQALTNAFGADQGFTNSKMWNPFWSQWQEAELGRVIWGVDIPRPMGAIHEPLKAAGLWHTYGRATAGETKRSSGNTLLRYSDPVPATGPINVEGSRNVYLFQKTRKRPHGNVSDYAHALNARLTNPMKEYDLLPVIRSIEQWETLHDRDGGAADISDEERARLSEMGRRGGNANTEAQREARSKGTQSAAVMRSAEADGRRALICSLAAEGWSQSRIMAHTGYSRSTVARALRDTK